MKKNIILLLCLILALNICYCSDQAFNQIKAECKTLNSFELNISVSSEHNVFAYLVFYSYDASN